MVETESRADKLNSLLVRKLHPSALYNPDNAAYHRRLQAEADRLAGIHTYPGDWSSSASFVRSEPKTEELPISQQKVDTRKLYSLKGSLRTDEMPIRLEDDMLANNDVEAKSIARRKIRFYRNLEGYAVSLHLYDPANKQIGYFHLPKKRLSERLKNLKK